MASATCRRSDGSSALAIVGVNLFVTFNAFPYNANSAQMPCWALATYFFLRSFEMRAWRPAALAGVMAALAMLSKYYAIFLIAGLVAAALTHRDRWIYLRSLAPWVTIAVGLACLGPHLYWLATHTMTPLTYAEIIHSAGLSEAVVESLKTLASLILQSLLLSIFSSSLSR